MRFDRPTYLASLALADPQHLWKERKKHMDVVTEHLAVASFIDGLIEKSVLAATKPKAKVS
ncbi:MAG: hypothetical protein LCH88_17315 [Proteobacteria bacterium]|nr:hypothetical protein [Pseudomonadota bacterium]